MVGEKAMTMDALKDEILENVGHGTLLIRPDDQHLSTGIRYWLEDAISSGVKVVCIAPANPGKDTFLGMLEVELELPSNGAIRNVMQAKVERLRLKLDRSHLVELQPLAGRHTMWPRKWLETSG